MGFAESNRRATKESMGKPEWKRSSYESGDSQVLGSQSTSEDWPRICPDIIQRSQWEGRTPVAVDYAIVPVNYVVVHHTVTPECNSKSSCSEIMRSIQNFHMDNLEFHDIGYNFIVGGDGNVYEGAGWHKVGAHTRGYNSRSLGLAFIGNFSDKLPNPKQLKAAEDFLQCAVELENLTEVINCLVPGKLVLH
ncbi:hypothetical protein NQ317_015430 [Molorchus minor]|uniref:Peptidoglycan-recognition protein n=1 Tax=Molorchus minor TaxID=1323400 RepID=A0ABQ9IX54_9CUCU|nr:hypothetical protein NQ317_015430 [Molorchus minor]